MAFVRGLGWVLLLLTAAAGVYEVADYIDSGDRALTALGELWFKLHPPSLNLMQAVTERYLHEGLWDAVVRPALLQPVLLVVGGSALIALTIGHVFRRDESAGSRRRHRRRR